MPRLFLSALLILLFSAVYAAELSGRVVGISNGDTFTLLTADKQQVKIRLAEIDAPESGQPYGNKSKQALSGLIIRQSAMYPKTDVRLNSARTAANAPMY